MKSQVKFIALLLGIGLSIGFIVSAAPTINYQQSIFPITTNTYNLGTSTRQWLRFAAQNASTTITSADTLCLTGDACRTTWPTGGGGLTDQLGQIGDVSTSTLSFGHLLMWDGTNWQDTATSALGLGGSSGTVSSVAMTVPTGLTISGSPITTIGTLAVALDTGYIIPLTASTTNWDSFFAIPSSRITDGTGLTWSSNTLNVDDPFSVTKLTATNASTTYFSIATNGWLNSNPIVSNVTGSQTQLAAFSGTNTITPTSTIGLSMIAGLGTIAVQNADNVSITGGSVTGITDLTVSDGGTGASTLSGFLYGNGTSAFTGTTTPYFSLGFYAGATSTMNGSNICTAANGACPGGSGTPGGANTQVQFNDSSAFGGNAGFTFDKTGTLLTITNASSTAFSVPSGGFFNLNATGTMQGFALCTAGNGACGAANANATVTASEEIWNCVPQTDSTGFAPGGAFIDVLGENLLAIHQMNATTSAIYCRWHIPDDIAASPSAVLYTNFSATTSGNLAIDLYATTTPPSGGNYGPFGAWTTIKAGSTSPVTLSGGSAYQSTSTTSPISLTLTAGHDLIIRMIRWGADANDTVENAAFFVKAYLQFLRKVN